jgi:predicted MPP superfamily phosphohydrolase
MAARKPEAESEETATGSQSAAMNRRRFLAVAGVATIGVGGAAAGFDAFTGSLTRVEVTRATLPVLGLPADLAGLQVLHLTDIHLYDGLHAGARRAIELAQEAKPDITFLTGDIVEAPDQLATASEFMRECRGRLATVATLGNWEHAMGVTNEEMGRSCEAAGAVFLFNESHRVTVGAGSLSLVGLDDPRSGRPDPARALRDVPSDAPMIWGFHAPGYADRLKRQNLPRPALMLAGHTHGGQIRLPPIPAITPYGSGRFVAGWYRDTFAPLYVGRGIGTSDIRARFLCPPEMTLFTLAPA